MSINTKYTSAPSSPSGVTYNFSPKKALKVDSLREKIDFSSGAISSPSSPEKKRTINITFQNEFEDTSFVPVGLPNLAGKKD